MTSCPLKDAGLHRADAGRYDAAMICLECEAPKCIHDNGNKDHHHHHRRKMVRSVPNNAGK